MKKLVIIFVALLLTVCFASSAEDKANSGFIQSIDIGSFGLQLSDNGTSKTGVFTFDFGESFFIPMGTLYFSISPRVAMVQTGGLLCYDVMVRIGIAKISDILIARFDLTAVGYSGAASNAQSDGAIWTIADVIRLDFSLAFRSKYMTFGPIVSFVRNGDISLLNSGLMFSYLVEW